MKTKQILSVLIFMLAIPLVSYGQHLFNESHYWMKHANGEEEFYNINLIWKGNWDVIEGKQYYRFVDSRNKEYFCRIEDGKLFRYDATNGNEYVLCDYNLTEGDVFQTKDGREMKVVQAGDKLMPTAFHENYARHFVELENVNDASDKDLWIDGIGSYYNILMFPEEKTDDIVEQYFMWNDYNLAKVFTTDEMKTQLMKVEREDDFDYFDEETGEIYYLSDSLHCEFVKDTLVVSGRVFTNCCVGHYLICRVHDRQITFTVDEIPPSAACESSHYFTAKFPGFKPGEYTFEYIPPGGGSPSGKLEITGDLMCKGFECKPFVEDGKVWDTRRFTYYYNVQIGNNKRKSLTYELSGDTIIGGTPCVKMYAYEKFQFIGKQYLASLYEQEGKVFFFPVESETPYLLYDFNVSKGDIVKVFKGPEYQKNWSPVEVSLEVENQDEVDINGTKRKRLYMKELDSSMTEDTGAPVVGEWIEGIGTMSSPVWNAGFIRYDEGSDLELCRVDDEILYEAAEPDYYNMLDANTVWYSDYSANGIRQIGGNAMRMYFTQFEAPDIQPGVSGTDCWRKIYAYNPKGNAFNAHMVGALCERLKNDGSGEFERKVYIKPYEGSEKSYLLYDFSAEVGDEIEVGVFSFDDSYGEPHELKTRKCRVDYVEDKLVEASIVDNSAPRELKAREQLEENVPETYTARHHLKHLYLTVADENGSYENGTTVCWIEGVGSVYGLDCNAGTTQHNGQYPESLLVDCSWDGEPFYKFTGTWSDIVNSIETPKTSVKSNVIYDLSGRRLNQVPKRGMYIQNGKVIIK